MKELATRIHRADIFEPRATSQMAATWSGLEIFFQPNTHNPRKVELEEKRQQGLNRQRGAKNIADKTGILRPVHTKLKFLDDAGDHARGEVDQEQFSPEFGHAQVDLLAGAQVDRLHDGDQERHTNGQGDKEKMKDGCESKLELG